MKLVTLLSGGKDSLYATYLANKENEISVIIAMKSKNPESYMFHVPNIDLVKLQAESMKVPLIFKTTQGIKEEELEDLKGALKEAKEKYGVEGVVSGAIFSEYQKTRIEKICNELGLKSLTPLWKISEEKLWNNLINNNFEIIITAVGAGGLDKSWLGKKIDKQVIAGLANLHEKNHISTIFEGGEAESLVLNCPLFEKPIKVLDSEIKWDSKTESGEMFIKDAKLHSELS